MPVSGDYIFEPYKVKEEKCRGAGIPRPRSGHRIVCDDKKIYCFGGYNPTLPVMSRDDSTWSPEKPLFKEIWSYSIATRRWKQHKILKNMPEELASNAMCLNGRYLMVFGGTGAPFGNRCSNDLITWRVDSGDTDLQIVDVKGSRPPGQYGQAVICHDTFFYTIGGTNGFAYNSDIYRLDLRTLTWEIVFMGTGSEEEPLGRYRHEVARVGNKLYIIGGGTGEWAFELMDIPCFDLETKTWTRFSPTVDNPDENVIPISRKCHSAVQVDTPNGVQVFVAGGSNGQTVFDDIWRLSIDSMQWTLMKKTSIPHPLYFHSSAATSYGCMFMFGGIQPKNEMTCRNNKLYKVWLCIPKLSEICFEALMHLFPRLESKDRSALLRLGIPSHLVERITL